MFWIFLACKGGFALDASNLDIGAVEAPVACVSQVADLMVTQDIKNDARLLADSFLFVEKESRRMGLYQKGELVDGGCWHIALGFTPQGHKQKEGDGKTPEGWYTTSDKPTSSFEGAIAVHYPNQDDVEAGVFGGTISRRQAEQMHGQIQRGEKPEQASALGGEILIHGGGSGSACDCG